MEDRILDIKKLFAPGTVVIDPFLMEQDVLDPYAMSAWRWESDTGEDEEPETEKISVMQLFRGLYGRGFNGRKLRAEAKVSEDVYELDGSAPFRLCPTFHVDDPEILSFVDMFIKHRNG